MSPATCCNFAFQPPPTQKKKKKEKEEQDGEQCNAIGERSAIGNAEQFVAVVANNEEVADCGNSGACCVDSAEHRWKLADCDCFLPTETRGRQVIASVLHSVGRKSTAEHYGHAHEHASGQGVAMANKRQSVLTNQIQSTGLQAEQSTMVLGVAHGELDLRGDERREDNVRQQSAESQDNVQPETRAVHRAADPAYRLARHRAYRARRWLLASAVKRPGVRQCGHSGNFPCVVLAGVRLADSAFVAESAVALS